ncbi:hypothetical protein NDU88_004534 [Pleurodeles waltl]|uniref:Uncharacterized protein n=1 Tax=Pleurodeles waltl TaxID=8319 RepID=A0AAV7VHD3_PLEWA|nr:hypothetical protein NDU88_004534 [Pleurodeles waltl]
MRGFRIPPRRQCGLGSAPGLGQSGTPRGRKRVHTVAGITRDCVSADPDLFQQLGSAFRPDTRNQIQIITEAGWLSTVSTRLRY